MWTIAVPRIGRNFYQCLEALPLLTGEPVDLLFLDIEMPDINGLAFLRTLQKHRWSFSLPPMRNSHPRALKWMPWTT